MCYVESVSIRRAKPSDLREVVALCVVLWPDSAIDEHEREVSGKIASGKSGTLPLVILVAEDESKHLAGFIEVGLRSHADGCDPARPVGFVEGWFVSPSFRGLGIGRKLMQAAERWAREQGCTEMASDALIENSLSQQSHCALGFEVVDRCVHFKKDLRPVSET